MMYGLQQKQLHLHRQLTLLLNNMEKEKKYYVVWQGVTPGIYESWAECQLQVKGYKDAAYRSFKTREEAENAFAAPYERPEKKEKTKPNGLILPSDVVGNSLAVDAACSGNPGMMEYRGVHTASRQEVFHFGPIKGTNNIGEFLAIVHGLAYLKKYSLDMPIYSDSRNAILWIRQKKCKTRLQKDKSTEKAFEMIARAEKWLAENDYNTKIMKWDTDKWGEIPADFGRK